MSAKPKLQYPDRVQMAQLPTPLQAMPRLSKKYGVEIFFKRDDYTGSELSGNKIRKLEFLLAEAGNKGCDIVLTCGGAQSNHCRATALAAARCGMSSLLLLRTPDPDNPPETEGNILLDRLAGAQIAWVTPDEYKRRDELFQRETERLRGGGWRPYVIPEGGSNALGAWGYVQAVDELYGQLEQMDDGQVEPTTVISAVGSGGTTAGLVLGNKILDCGLRIIGVNVSENEEYFVNVIGGICSSFPVKNDIGRWDIEILDGYVGLGYAQSRPEELEAIAELAALEGVVLDPVYTGKAYYGMISELARDPKTFGGRIVFVHTGGLFGLFPIAGEMAEIL